MNQQVITLEYRMVFLYNETKMTPDYFPAMKAGMKGRKNGKTEIAKYTIKDSIFTNLFQDKKYLIQLYRALHPEDTETTEDELKDITIKNILVDACYNDLGFTVGDKIMVLTEAQSTWTMNIIIRALMYLVQSYHEYFERRNDNLYSSKKVKLPKPELYVIFTGKRVSKPEYVSLSEEFFNGEDCAIDVKVKMIYDGKNNDIISQYVAFTKVYDEQVKLYGRTREAVTNTINICKDRDVLKEYLSSREKEVVDMMMTLFDEEQVMRAYVESERKEAAKQVAKGTIQKMLENGKLTVDELRDYFPYLSDEEIIEIKKEIL